MNGLASIFLRQERKENFSSGNAHSSGDIITPTNEVVFSVHFIPNCLS